MSSSYTVCYQGEGWRTREKLSYKNAKEKNKIEHQDDKTHRENKLQEDVWLQKIHERGRKRKKTYSYHV